MGQDFFLTMEAGAYRQLRPLVTALPGPTAINVNTAPGPVLMSLAPGIDDEDVAELIELRTETPFASAAEFRRQMAGRVPLSAAQTLEDAPVTVFFSFARLGPIYRVSLAGRGLTGKGLLAVMPIGRRVALADVRLTLSLPSVDNALREALFRPQGRAEVTIDRFEAGLDPWRIDALAGRARWDGARSERVPEVDFGAVEAQLSVPERNLIRADIVNREGDVALSGEVSLAMNEGFSVDLYMEPRSGASDVLAHALGPLAARENTGWRLRHTIAAGDWI